MEEHADKGKLDGLEVPETRLDIRDSRPIGVDQTIDFDSPNGPNAKAGNPNGLTQTIASSNSDGTATVSEPPVPSVELQTRQHLLSGVDTPGYILLDAPLEGGMGAVYRAWNIQLERVVALKLSKLEGNNSSNQDQLRTEAANLARIEHPSIASCYGFGHFDGFSFFEMQWIEGVTLHELIEFLHQHNLQRSLENRVVLQWGKSLTEALIYCQMRGLNHLDLKPKNVMLTSSVGRQDSHATVVESIP